MTNQYMTKLYHDLLSNSPQTVTIDIPADMGTGQISQVVTKQGAVVSDWKMNYFSDMNVQGVSCEDYIQLLFCFNDGVSWNIADARQSVSIQKGESCIYRGHGKMEYLCYSGKKDFLFKNIRKSTHNLRECPVYGHRGGSRGRFYYRITTFEGRPWDARDPHKTTFMTLKHAIRLSIWRKQKETPGVEKAPGVSSPQRKESGRSGRDDGELRFGYDPAIHARRLRVYHRPRRLRMALRISIILYSRRFSPANLMG